MTEYDPRTIYYVYDISRPDTQETCYIGKGNKNGKRWQLSATGKRGNPYLRSIVTHYREQGLTMLVTIVRDNLSEKEAYDTEIALVAALGRKDKEEGHLANMDDGGKGRSAGFVHTTESKNKMRQSQARRASQENPETRRKRLQEYSLKGAIAKRAKYTREQLSEIVRKGRANMTPEQRRISRQKQLANSTFKERSNMALRREASYTDEQRNKRSNNIRQRWANMTDAQRKAIGRKRQSYRNS